VVVRVWSRESGASRAAVWSQLLHSPRCDHDAGQDAARRQIEQHSICGRRGRSGWAVIGGVRGGSPSAAPTLPVRAGLPPRGRPPVDTGVDQCTRNRAQKPCRAAGEPSCRASGRRAEGAGGRWTTASPTPMTEGVFAVLASDLRPTSAQTAASGVKAALCRWHGQAGLPGCAEALAREWPGPGRSPRSPAAARGSYVPGEHAGAGWGRVRAPKERRPANLRRAKGAGPPGGGGAGLAEILGFGAWSLCLHRLGRGRRGGAGVRQVGAGRVWGQVHAVNSGAE